MSLEELKGEIAGIEDAAKTELEFSTFEKEEENLPEICESIEKFEKIKKEYVSKTVTLKARDPDIDPASLDEMVQKLTDKVKELRLLRGEITKEKKKKEKEKKAKEEEEARKLREAKEKREIEELEAEKKAKEAKEQEEIKKAKAAVKIKKAQLMVRMEGAIKTQFELFESYGEDRSNLKDSEVELKKEKITELNAKFVKNENEVFVINEKITSDVYHDKEIADKSGKIKENLEKIRDLKREFEEFIGKELIKRDLTKDKKEATTEIKLEMFSGEEDGPDFYAFKTGFDKKYSNVKKHQRIDVLQSYLTKQAKESVKEIKIEEEVWERLKHNFGDTEEMLKKKMIDIHEVASTFNARKSSREIKDILLKLTNKLKDVTKLVLDHKIEDKLYSKYEVNDVMGKFPSWFTTAWFCLVVDMKVIKKSNKEIWEALIGYLEKQTEVQRVKAASEAEVNANRGKDTKGYATGHFGQSEYPQSSSFTGANGCPLGCDRIHTKGKELTECSRFLRIRSPSHRLGTIKKLPERYCFQCLGNLSDPNHNAECNTKYCCAHKDHDSFRVKFHVLLCQNHCEDNDNVKLFEDFKNDKFQGAQWATNIKLSFIARNAYPSKGRVKTEDIVSSRAQLNLDDDEVEDEGLYLLQTIEVDGKEYGLFYDDGCGSAMLSKEGANKLNTRATLLCPDPIKMGGIGECETSAEHGLYKFRLPLISGQNAVIVAPCITKITVDFPVFPLGEILEEAKTEARKSWTNINSWPSMHHLCGGVTDIMIGQRYRKYYPREICRLPSGLAIFESRFAGPNGSNGVIGGPSRVVTKLIERLFGHCSLLERPFLFKQYLTKQLETYRHGYSVDIDKTWFSGPVSMECLKMDEDDPIEEEYADAKRGIEQSLVFISKKEKKFQEFDEAGTDLNYRCPKCRGCTSCLNGEKLNSVSLQEEGEQYLIDQCVHVSVEERKIEASLPLTNDPLTSLGEGKARAMKIYQQQVKKLSERPEDKADVVKAEGKMQSRGHVMLYEDLSEDIKELVEKNNWSHFIPWRSVWNGNSLTTSCRMVFDLSATTETGTSLNDILPKGVNQINNLVQVFIKWRCGPEAFHTDITQMYPSVYLLPQYWSLQKYLWSDGLNPGDEPKVKVVMRIIIGGKASGGIAISGVKKLAEEVKHVFPKGTKVLVEEIYVDDVLPAGQASHEECVDLAVEIEGALHMGGLKVKGFTFSGEDPHPDLTRDGTSIGIAGMRWHSKVDEIQLDIDENLNFAEKIRGKKDIGAGSFNVPNPLLRRHVAGKVAEVWDLCGEVTPMVGRFKLDLHTLVERGLDWDDAIPEELLTDWQDNFEIIKEMRHLRFPRTVIPRDALNLDVETIEAGDASARMIIIGIYTRILCKDGTYRCKLVLGKSKIVPKGMTIPRAELTAARISAQAGHIVHRALAERHVKRIHVTDNEVALYWIHSWEKPLKQFVRGSVVDILRLTEKQNWYWIPSEFNPCDIGTRRKVEMKDIEVQSEWQIGKEWMRGRVEDMPIKTIEEIKLSGDKENDYKAEFAGSRSVTFSQFHNKAIFDENEEYESQLNIRGRSYVQAYLCINNIPQEVSKRLYQSQYLVDPCRFTFNKLVRITSLVFMFARKCRRNALLKKGKVLQVHVCVHQSLCNESLEKHFGSARIHFGKSIKKNSALSSKEIIRLREKIVQDFIDVPAFKVVIISEEVDYDRTLTYLFGKGTAEVEKFCAPKLWKNCSKREGIRYWETRVLPDQKFSNEVCLTQKMWDLDSTMFCVPLLDQYSPLAWSVVLEMHWNNTDSRHAGVPTVVRYAGQVAHIFNCSQVAQAVKENCARCHQIRKKTIDVRFGPLSEYQLKVAQAFFITQCDLFGPMKAYSLTNARQTFKAWGCVFVCLTTSACSIQIMEDYTAAQFIQAYTRFSCQRGHARILLVDEGKNVVCGASEMSVNWVDVNQKLSRDKKIIVEVAPVGDHHEQGKVERKIRQIKETLARAFEGERCTALEWQTMFDVISNTINNMPICHDMSSMSGVKDDVDNLDIITPNRLLLGRNNDLAPVGPMVIARDARKVLHNNAEIFRVWWEGWMDVAIPQLLNKPQATKEFRNTQKGDIVLCRRHEGDMDGSYRYGIIEETYASADGVVRKADVRYRNCNEEVDRETYRNVHKLVLIRRADEVDIWVELFEASRICDAILAGEAQAEAEVPVEPKVIDLS